MTYGWKRLKRAAGVLLLLGGMLSHGGCATTSQRTGDLPPILTQDELLRPYTKIGVIEVHRERYGSSQDLSPADVSWGNQSLREAAGKLGADAVIFPELKTEQETHIIFPSSEMTAKGIAIKFR